MPKILLFHDMARRQKVRWFFAGQAQRVARVVVKWRFGKVTAETARCPQSGPVLSRRRFLGRIPTASL